MALTAYSRWHSFFPFCHMTILSVNLWRNLYEALTGDISRTSKVQPAPTGAPIASINELRVLLSGLSSTSNKSFLITVQEHGHDSWSPALQVHNVNNESFLAYDAKKIQYHRIPFDQIQGMKLNKSFGRFLGRKVYQIRS